MARGTNLSISDLERMIQDRQRDLTKLERQRSKWQKRVDELDRKIVALGGNAGGRGRGGRGGGTRARNDVSLPDAIAGVLSKAGGAVAVPDIVEGVLASGYRTNSGNFRAVVNQALIKDRRFKSAGRGIYQMKDGSAAGRGDRSKRRRRKPKVATEPAQA